MANDACTLSTREMREEINYHGAVMTHTHYGRGFRPSNEEMIANIKAAFNFAKSFGGDIMFVTDGEDVGFAPVDVPADEEGRLLDSEDALMFDQPIEDERMALLVYWQFYGFASDTPEDWALRKQIAEVADLDERFLEEPQ